jgi:TPR repeat protein
VTGPCDNGGMRNLLAVALLLVAATARAEDKGPKQTDTAKAFRECSLAQKVDPRTLTAAGKEAAESCVLLGMAYEDGDHVDESGKAIPANHTLAAQYFTIGCNLNVALGCWAMGQMFENGLATVAKGKDPRTLALAWYAKGCYAKDADTSNVALSCAMGGILAMETGTHKKGHASGKLLRVGFELTERACQLGAEDSCKALVEIERALSEDK